MIENSWVLDLKFTLHWDSSFPIENRSGVGIACIMKQRSLKRTKKFKNIQFKTLEKTCSCHVNYLHASCFGTGDLTMNDDGNGSCVSHVVKNSFLFKRFMKGCGI